MSKPTVIVTGAAGFIGSHVSEALLALGRKPEALAAIRRAQEIAPHDARVQQVASQLAADNPVAGAITWIVRLSVFGILLAVAGFVLYTLKSTGVFGAP